MMRIVSGILQALYKYLLDANPRVKAKRGHEGEYLDRKDGKNKSED